MIRQILNAQDERLRTKSKPVAKIDRKIKTLINDLKETLRAQDDPEGIGLAAAQIGKNLQIFIMKPGDSIKVVINPKILSVKKVKPTEAVPKTMEGCLSLPHYYSPIVRSREVTIKYLSEKGEEKTQTFRNLEAQIVLHEIDHLEGKLFVDKVLKQKKPLYELVDGEWHEVDLLL
jgi:peptide deformylase